MAPRVPRRLRRTGLAVIGIAAVAAFVKNTLGWPKVNFGAIGNLVPQLHLHVVGRRPGDACWPAPVWGNLPEGETWAPTRVEDLVARLVATTGLSPTGTARNPGPPA